MNVKAEENGVQGDYKVSSPIDFFNSVNEWLDIEGEQEAFVRAIVRTDGTMVLVDGCDDRKMILGIIDGNDAEVLVFHSEKEAFGVIKEFVNKSDKVDILKPEALH
jgi:hypothetical protein